MRKQEQAIDGTASHYRRSSTRSMSKPVMTIQKPMVSGPLAPPEGDYERFLFSVSHDLQEPLRMIASYLKLLEMKAVNDLSPEAKQFLESGIQSADRMKDMIYALVELSRVGRNNEVPQSIDVNSALQDLSNMYSTEFNQVQGKLVWEGLPNVEMVPSQMLQLFKIFIQNSIDNAADRPLEIKVSGEVLGDRVELTFADNGVGINSVYLDKVFELFKKVDQRSPNIGAGLAIAKDIIRKYEGEISLTSEEGVGTAIVFTLPIDNT